MACDLEVFPHPRIMSIPQAAGVQLRISSVREDEKHIVESSHGREFSDGHV